MVIGVRRPGHRPPGRPAHGIGIVFVLDAQVLVEIGVVEAGDIAGGIDPRGAGAKTLVDEDPVVHLEPHRLRQTGVRLDADPGDHTLHCHRLAILRREHAPLPVRLQAGDRAIGEHLDAPVAVVVGHKTREPRRKDTLTDILAREEQDNLLTVHGESRRDLRADKPAANDGKALATLGEAAERE